jgi:RNA polymerase sigma factor (sigma-70 family)
MARPRARRPARQDPRPGPGSRLPARLLRRTSDERLVAYVRDGSEPAFEVLFDRHYRRLLGFCVHMLGSVEEAEDAVQHAFLAAYRTMVTSERRIQLRPWLYTVARNRCLAVLQARRERPSVPLEEPATENLFAEVQRREDVRDLLRDLARLPEDQRAALLLAEAAAMPHAEIAAVLGCPRTKVKSLVFQARSSLIAGRTARATPCREIREQIATLHGPALRRRTIRRHLPQCAGCREFRDEVRRQRRALAVALPVTSSLAVKEAVLAALFGTGAAGAGGAAAGFPAALAAKALIVVALLGAGGAGLALRHDDPPAEGKASAPTERAGPALGDAADPPTGRGPATAVPVADDRSDQRPRAREGDSVQSPERTAALPDRGTRRGSNAAPTEEVTEPRRGVGRERHDGAPEDEAKDGKARRPRRQPEPVEPQRAPAPPPAPAAPPPEPVREAVDSNEESDVDDEGDDPIGHAADEDDDDSDANTAVEVEDDDSDANTADDDDDEQIGSWGG